MVRVRGSPLEPLKDFHPVHLGQLQVQQNQLRGAREGALGVGSIAEEELEGLLAVARHGNVVGQVFSAESVESELHIIRIIFYH